MNGKWPKVMVISAITSLWLLYDIMTQTEAPGQALALVQYALLGLALISLIGSAVQCLTGR